MKKTTRLEICRPEQSPVAWLKEFYFLHEPVESNRVAAEQQAKITEALIKREATRLDSLYVEVEARQPPQLLFFMRLLTCRLGFWPGRLPRRGYRINYPGLGIVWETDEEWLSRCERELDNLKGSK